MKRQCNFSVHHAASIIVNIFPFFLKYISVLPPSPSIFKHAEKLYSENPWQSSEFSQERELYWLFKNLIWRIVNQNKERWLTIKRGKRAQSLKVPEVAVAEEQLLLLGQGRKTGRESFPELGCKPFQKGHTYCGYRAWGHSWNLSPHQCFWAFTLINNNNREPESTKEVFLCC